MSKDILQQPNSEIDTLEWIGELARHAASRWPETYHQVFPEWISPGLVDRCKAVSEE